MRRHGLGLACAWILVHACLAFAANPAVELRKTVYAGHNGGTTCAAGIEEVFGTSGAPVTYCFEVVNTGDTYLASITLTDGGIGIPPGSATVVSGSQPLAPGAALLLYFQHAIVIDLQSTAATSANPTDSAGNDLPGLPLVGDDDTARVNLIAPAITIAKTVYAGHSAGTGCPGGDDLTGPVGTAITYCFLLENTGDTHLGSVAIADPSLGITDAAMTRILGAIPLQPNGPSDKLLYYYQTTITADVVNEATLTANPVDSGGADLVGVADVSAADIATVDEFTPTTTSSSTTTSTSTTSTTIQVCDCQNLPFLARSTAKLATGATVNADLGVNSEVGLLRMAPGSIMADGTTIFAHRVKLADGARAYNVRANLVIAAPTAAIDGSVGPVFLPLVPEFCSLPPSTCGSSAVTVAGPATELVLPAGNYGTVSIADGALLRLVDPGTYRFCELKLWGAGTLLAHQQVTIEVAGSVNVGTGSAIRTVSGAPLILNVGGPKLRIGRDAQVDAAITAPAARTKVRQNALVRGCVCSNVLQTAPAASLTCAGG